LAPLQAEDIPLSHGCNKRNVHGVPDHWRREIAHSDEHTG
jgi:hypothetical protein